MIKNQVIFNFYHFENGFKNYITNVITKSPFSFVDLVNFPNCILNQIEYLEELRTEKEGFDKIPLNEDILSAVEGYCGYSYDWINRSLRGLPVSKSQYESTEEYLAPLLDKAISEIPITQNLCVVRRLSKKGFKSMIRFPKRGKKFKDNGFMSTSLNPYYRLDNESKEKPLNNEVLMLLKLPKGVNGLYIPNWIGDREEDELLLHREAQFVIDEVKRFRNNLFVAATYNS